MQQSHNFEQLQRLVAEKGDKLWELAFEGDRPLAGYTERRFALRHDHNAQFLEYWVRCSDVIIWVCKVAGGLVATSEYLDVC
jgi:hypothetical protein